MQTRGLVSIGACRSKPPRSRAGSLTYSLAFGAHDSTVLAYSLVADIALPVLLLVHVPTFFGKAKKQAAGS